jgi:hypothetical protein
MESTKCLGISGRIVKYCIHGSYAIAIRIVKDRTIARADSAVVGFTIIG